MSDIDVTCDWESPRAAMASSSRRFRLFSPGRVRLLVAVTVFLVSCWPLFSQSQTHTVVANETIYSIARHYGVDPDALLKANHISDPRMLRIGTVLTIPAAYQVKKGDTLYGISRRYGISLSDLLDANGFPVDHILHVGDTVVIPAASAPRIANATSSGRADAATTGGGERGDRPNSGGAASSSISDSHGAGGVAASGSSASSGSSSSGGASTSGASSVAGNGISGTGSGAETGNPGSDPTTGVQAINVSIAGPEASRQEDGPWPHPGTRYQLTGKFPGLLIKGKPGDPVVSVAAGRVIYTGPYSTFGNVVLVQSESGYVYVYGGNDKLSVTPGEQVDIGTVLGRLAKSFFQDGAEVYFSVWKNNQFINPSDAPRG